MDLGQYLIQQEQRRSAEAEQMRVQIVAQYGEEAYLLVHEAITLAFVRGVQAGGGQRPEPYPKDSDVVRSTLYDATLFSDKFPRLAALAD